MQFGKIQIYNPLYHPLASSSCILYSIILCLSFLAIAISCLTTGCNLNVVGGCSGYHKINTTVLTSQVTQYSCTRCVEEVIIDKNIYCVSYEYYPCYWVGAQFTECKAAWFYDWDITGAQIKQHTYSPGTQHLMLLNGVQQGTAVCHDASKTMFSIWAAGTSFLVIFCVSSFALYVYVVYKYYGYEFNIISEC